MWDVFISHASEDTEQVVLPLVRALQRAGVKVWVDAQELTLGDSLRRRIDQGLAGSRFGVLVLSPAFFRKEWPQRELDAALALEVQHGKKVLPVLHDLDLSALSMRAPLLADKVGVSTSSGMDVVAREILRAIGRPVTKVTPPRDVFEDPEDLVGTTIAGYRLESHIGRGGSGMVFRGSHPRFRQDLAIKVFYPLRRGFEHLSGLFQRGFRAVQAVRHPGVIAVFESGRVDLAGTRTTFMTTEFVAGSPIDEWMPTDSTRAEAFLERLRISWEIAGALAACHATTFVDELGFQTRGVLHGDIKPANILIDAEGHPRIIDFLQIDVQRLIDPRIAAHVEHEEALTTALGTPGFMAPEQERHGVVTEATDIFSLGITVGRFLAQSRSAWAFLHHELVSRELSALLMAMTSEDPSKRPSRMDEVEQALEAIYNAERQQLANG